VSAVSSPLATAASGRYRGAVDPKYYGDASEPGGIA
jgi:hypothetical protein